MLSETESEFKRLSGKFLVCGEEEDLGERGGPEGALLREADFVCGVARGGGGEEVEDLPKRREVN